MAFYIEKVKYIAMSIFKKIVKKTINYIFEPLNKKIEQQENMIASLARANFRTRCMLKRNHNQPISVLFICHLPSLWGMFASLYESMRKDKGFMVNVLAVPYQHNSVPKGKYKDGKMFEYLSNNSVSVMRGYNEMTDEWIDLEKHKIDYVFYQTPYKILPDHLSIENVSLSSKVCYMPYGSCIFSGEVDEIVHPPSFFRYASFIFAENKIAKEAYFKKISNYRWFDRTKLILSGNTKFDYLLENKIISGKTWKRGYREGIKRILWTPRWCTHEGTSHFFDYKDMFINFCKINKDVDFVFRPHPLCFQNFLKTGELSSEELFNMELFYENSDNMIMDNSGEYIDTFLSSDVLVSDISSMLLEYFVTGKPIIYTHRVNAFNDYGKIIADSLYWVRNESELRETLDMLISGNDPLKQKRIDICNSLSLIGEGKASEKIIETIRNDFID